METMITNVKPAELKISIAAVFWMQKLRVDLIEYKCLLYAQSIKTHS